MHVQRRTRFGWKKKENDIKSRTEEAQRSGFGEISWMSTKTKTEGDWLRLSF